MKSYGKTCDKKPSKIQSCNTKFYEGKGFINSIVRFNSVLFTISLVVLQIVYIVLVWIYWSFRYLFKMGVRYFYKN